MNKIVQTSITLGILGAMSTLTAGEKETVEKTFAVESAGTLHVSTDTGAIDIRGAEGNRVSVIVEIDFRTSKQEHIVEMREQMELSFDQKGDDVYVGFDWNGKRGWGWGGDKSPSLRFTITVPREYSTDLKTAGGALEIGNLTGRIAAKTSGGHIDLEAITGSVDVSTSGGHIAGRGIKGDLVARTSGGHITIEESEGRMELRTSGGHIEVDRVAGMIEARTSGGGIKATILGPLSGDCELRTSGGSITAYLDDRVAAELYAQTSAGSVETNVPVMLEGKLRRNQIAGKIGEGGYTLKMTTSAGNVRIRKLDT